MGATCVTARLSKKSRIEDSRVIVPVEDEILTDYPRLIKIKTVRSFTAFCDSYKHGNPFPLLQSKQASATILSYFGSIGASVDLC